MNRPKIVLGDVIATLRNCDGVYECPMNGEGNPLAPLVGYAGKYENNEGQLLAYVGFVYYNVGQGDQWPNIADHWAEEHVKKLRHFNCLDCDVLVAAPMGGIFYTAVLKHYVGCRGIFLEKKVLEAATDHRREKSKLIFGRYEIGNGEDVVLVEDIVNNFSTTEEMIALIEKAGGKVRGIVCIINRSANSVYFVPGMASPLAVISLQHKITPQYRQSDPEVERYVAAGNVIWKPKEEWGTLVEAMERYE